VQNGELSIMPYTLSASDLNNSKTNGEDTNFLKKIVECIEVTDSLRSNIFQIEMKIAVTALENSLSSPIDMHFGRAPFFVIFDKETKSVEFLPNPFETLSEGAGVAAIKLLADKGVSQIISGEVGNAIKGLIDAYRIQMIILKEQTKTVDEILTMVSNF